MSISAAHVPSWHRFMRPILELLADERVYVRQSVKEGAIFRFHLTPEQLAVTLPTGQTTADNRASWAVAALTKAGAVRAPEVGALQITAHGLSLLAAYPATIPVAAVLTTHAPSTASDDPMDLIEAGAAAYVSEVSDDLIRRLCVKSSAFFDHAVIEVLNAMGYVDQDPLGLNRIFIQAERYADGAIVGKPEVQGFVRSLVSRGANRGVFVTASTFSAEAREYAEDLSARVVLVDGRRLAALMIEYHIGVQVKRVFEVVEVDDEFFL